MNKGESYSSYEGDEFSGKSRSAIPRSGEFGSPSKLALANPSSIGLGSAPLASLDLSETQIAAMRILQDPPVENCELRPFVLLRDSKGNQSADLSEDILRYRWSKGQKRICSLLRCSDAARIQCLVCLRLKRPAHSTFFCSAEHLAQAWQSHRILHQSAGNKDSKKVAGDEHSWVDDDCEDGDSKLCSEIIDDPKKLLSRFPPPISNIWGEVSTSKLYTPKDDDVGRMLRLEVTTSIPQADGSFIVGSSSFTDTSPVLPEPEAPPPRQWVFSSSASRVSNGTFKVFSFNILADMYATRRRYPYCPLWSLLWTYRRNNILRELLSSQADVLCLQEVQMEHFDSFLYPKLKEAGYEGIFKVKTRVSMSDNPKQMDGCAIFFKEDTFALMEQYGIEYNEAARQHVQQQFQRQASSNIDPNYRTAALKRLLKGNIALVAVLEEINPLPFDKRTRGKRKRRLCVANTHIFWDPEFNDVKLWQTMVLCQELEKLVLSRQLPLIICGDFNSTVQSAVYQYLRTGSLRPDHEVFTNDEHRILPPASSITQRLSISSSYGELLGEPKYTNYTGDFIGVLDYIWFSRNALRVIGVLNVDEEIYLQEYTALPSPRYPSDHIFLLTELEWIS